MAFTCAAEPESSKVSETPRPAGCQQWLIRSESDTTGAAVPVCSTTCARAADDACGAACDAACDAGRARAGCSVSPAAAAAPAAIARDG